MGAVLTAPLSAVGTCLGGCFGSCVATGCVQLAGSGNVSSERAVRCVLVWLQVFVAALALLLSETADQWLPQTCSKFSSIGVSDIGICSCMTFDEQNCWSNQMVYRSEVAGTILFSALAIMAMSGCANGAARSHSVAKFMLIVVMTFISLFIPNKLFSAYGSISTGASALFLVAQAILLIDFAYSWNELWYSNALNARRREIGQKGYRMWTGAMVLASAGWFVGSVAISIYLYVAFPETSGRAVNVCSMVLSFSLLIVSITDWCEHGALLTSAVVMAYTVWLICEALAIAPSGKQLELPSWAGLTLCAISLLSTSLGSGSCATSEAAVQMTSTPAAQQESAAHAGEVEAGEAGGAHEEADSFTGKKAWMFAAYSGVHASATLYVAASLAPRTGTTTYGLRVTAIFVSLALYGWSLVAPKVLKNRRFN